MHKQAPIFPTRLFPLRLFNHFHLKAEPLIITSNSPNVDINPSQRAWQTHQLPTLSHHTNNSPAKEIVSWPLTSDSLSAQYPCSGHRGYDAHSQSPRGITLPNTQPVPMLPLLQPVTLRSFSRCVGGFGMTKKKAPGGCGYLGTLTIAVSKLH